MLLLRVVDGCGWWMVLEEDGYSPCGCDAESNNEEETEDDEFSTAE